MRDVFRRMMNAAIISAIAALASKRASVYPAGATTTGPAMNTAFAIFSNGGVQSANASAAVPQLASVSASAGLVATRCFEVLGQLAFSGELIALRPSRYL